MVRNESLCLILILKHYVPPRKPCSIFLKEVVCDLGLVFPSILVLCSHTTLVETVKPLYIYISFIVYLIIYLIVPDFFILDILRLRLRRRLRLRVRLCAEA